MKQILTLHGLFEEQASLHPHFECLVDCDLSTITYEQLNRKANRLAHYIQSMHFPGSSVIVVTIERSIDFVAALLAVLKTGHVFLAVDPSTSSERFNNIVQVSNPSLIISRTIMDNTTEHLILSHWDMFSECEEQNLGLSIDTSSSAYLIFTSGSSGKQKCTIGTHIGVINRCQYMWDSYPYNDNDVCCSKTVVSFTDFIAEIFQPLLKGVPLRLVNDSWRTDIHVLVEALSESKVTRLATVPSVLDTLFNMYDLPRVLPHLNHWESSGETLSVEVSRKYLSLSDSVTLLNVYGSSEVSSDLTFHRVTMSDVHRGVIPIGQPINGMKVYLVDEFQQLADQGEIVVSGVGLAKGYLNNELLTSERFVECQFDTCPAFSRMYKMGDFGKRLKNGDLVYLGRIDNQVKIRGMLVDLEEVEILIEKCPGVTKCVTKFWKESDSFGFLVAYLTLSQTQFEIQDIPLFLKDKLMDYMIPSKYVVLDQLPLNCNGKIDRSQLDKPIITVNSDYSNEVESDLCETINQILGIQVGPDDEIDSLGISSLNISLIKMKLKKDKGIIVSHRDFILSFTLRDLATKVVHFAEAGDHADSYHTGIESPQQDKLHIPSDIHTWPNQFPVVDLHSGISFDYYDENDMDEVSLFAATIYETEEPLANFLRLSAAETLYFFTPFFMEVPNHNLSIIAKLNGKVVGCSLAIDNYNMNKLASPGNPIDPTWIERHAPVFEVLDKAMEGYQRIEQPGIVMYQSFTAIDPEVSKYGVGVILEKLSIALGKKAGFQKAIAECSTLFTRILCEQNGYKFGPLVKYDPFIDSKGGRPFKGLPGGVVLAQLDLTTAEDDISNHYFPQSKAKVSQTLLGKAH